MEDSYRDNDVLYAKCGCGNKTFRINRKTRNWRCNKCGYEYPTPDELVKLR